MYKEYNINDNKLKKLNYVKNNLDSIINYSNKYILYLIL